MEEFTELSIRKSFRKNILPLKTNSQWIIYEFFESIIDKIIKINQQNLNIQLFSCFPDLNYKSRKDFKTIKQKLYKLKKIPRIFSNNFIQKEIQSYKSKKSFVKLLLKEWKRSKHNANYGKNNDINYIISPLTIGSKILVKYFDESKSHYYINIGHIDAVNYLNEYYRIAYENPTNTHIKVSDNNIMPLEEYEIIKLDEVLNHFNNNFSTSNTLMAKDVNSKIIEELVQSESQEKLNTLIYMAKISPLLCSKENIISELSCLNLLAEREGLFYSDSQMKIALKYAELLSSLSYVNKTIDFFLNQLHLNTSKIINSGQELDEKGPSSPLLIQNLNKIDEISSDKLSLVTSTKIRNIISLLLCYFSDNQTSQDSNFTNRKHEVTNQLSKLLPTFHSNYLKNIILPELDAIYHVD